MSLQTECHVQEGPRSLESSMERVNVVSYNVLSSALASPDWFTKCSPEHLSSSNRLYKLCEKLEKCMQNNSIICLQEVSREWAGYLYVFFSHRNYYFITSLYGNALQDYMGIGMAIPLKAFVLKEVNIKRIADTKELPKREESKGTTFFNVKTWCPWTGNQTITKNSWEESLKKQNTMISVRLVHLGKQQAKPFCIGTYHMPCAYQYPEIMLIHASLAAQHLQEFAQGQEHIFAGDFNFEPHSPPYELYTKNTIESDAIEPLRNDDWSPKLKTLLQSAYASHSGEPEVTNYASNDGKPCFHGTIDYIFISPGIKCISTEELPTLAYLKGRCESLPMATEPSDHLLIGATLLMCN